MLYLNNFTVLGILLYLRRYCPLNYIYIIIQDNCLLLIITIKPQRVIMIWLQDTQR